MIYNGVEGTDEERNRERRANRRKEMKLAKQRQIYLRRLAKYAFLGMFGVALLCIILANTVWKKQKEPAAENGRREAAEAGKAVQGESDGVITNGILVAKQAERPVDKNLSEPEAENYIQGPQKNYEEYAIKLTDSVGDDVVSTRVILVDLKTRTIIGERDAEAIMDPASMTKILTVLVAAEHITEENLQDPFTITSDITDYSYRHGCSAVGFDNEETVTVKDLFYGTILPSGGDAALALAVYTAGSQEEFVELMNQKLAELGLAETAHFTNCIGLFDEEHFCTVRDMAIILEAAIDNPLCRKVLSAHKYTTSSTQQHPDGIEISNWFLRRIEDKDTHGEVICAKTGFVKESGNCAASYALDESGSGYICVTADSTSSWRCIYDHVAIYQQFLQPGLQER